MGGPAAGALVGLILAMRRSSGKPNDELADVAPTSGSAGPTRGGAPGDGREQTDMIPDPGKSPDTPAGHGDR